MRAHGQHSRQRAKDEHRRRGGNAGRARWPHRRVLPSLPRWRRALDRIEQALLAEDPGLSLRFAFFARLTSHEPMPETEQVPGRLQRTLRRVAVLPLLAIGLAGLVAACWLTPGSKPACPAGPNTAARTLQSLSHAARCQPGPVIRLDTAPVR
jgi:hypothetical protein